MRKRKEESPVNNPDRSADDSRSNTKGSLGGAANVKYDALTSCRADHAHVAAFKFQFRDRRVPVKSSERFCSMQIQTVDDVRASSRILGEQKKERKRSRKKTR